MLLIAVGVLPEFVPRQARYYTNIVPRTERFRRAAAWALNGEIAMNTDGNLLFGVLAMQIELISLEQFGQACTMWVARKERPLGEILLELKWITLAEFHEVDRLLSRMLRKHKGNVRQAPQIRLILRSAMRSATSKIP